MRNDACVDREDECPPEAAGRFSVEGDRIETEDGHVVIVRTDRATALTTLDIEDSEGVLLDSRVLDADDLLNLKEVLIAATEHSRTCDVPVVINVSAALGRE